MAEKMRYNKIIDLLEHGKPVFSTSTVPKPAKPEPNRLKYTQETRGAGGEVEAAANGALPQAPRRGALLL